MAQMREWPAMLFDLGWVALVALINLPDLSLTS